MVWIQEVNKTDLGETQQVKISNRFASLENSDDSWEGSSAWENTKL